MPILGTALLALCYLTGLLLGDALGKAIGVDANVGGVGFAMLLLLAARGYMQASGRDSPGLTSGITFWAAIYIPVVIAMAASQNVFAAVKGGPIALLAALASVVACFLLIALINRSRFARADADWAAGSEPPPGDMP